MTTQFQPGNRVKKITGDYSFEGVVQSRFTKNTGEERLVVEDDRGALHIYSDKNLALVGNSADHEYLRVLSKLLRHGVRREGRNGATLGLFGEQMRFDLLEGFPLLTTKKVHFKGVVAELLWFISGDTNVKFLHDHGVTIWDEWIDENGDLGPVYGKQWRDWVVYGPSHNDPIKWMDPHEVTKWSYGGEKHIWKRSIDQLKNVIEGIKNDPYGRRHIVTAWNPAEIQDMALPPCHTMFQFHVANGRLSCHLYQRSADWFLGVPYNVASYALMTLLVARECGLKPGEFIHSFGDLHLYENHLDQAREQLKRQPRQLPDISIHSPADIFGLKVEDIVLLNYDPHPAIKAEVSK